MTKVLVVEDNELNMEHMDISLPGIDGIKTANIIKNRSEYRDVPVIALTALVMKGDKEKLLDSGFIERIMKLITFHC